MSPTHTGGTVRPGAAVEARNSAPEPPGCRIRDILDRIGDKWSVLVIVELTGGPRRFRELLRSIDGISQRMLTLTVRRLERDGLVIRTVYPTVPARVDYRLTDVGTSLAQLLRALAGWSREHRDRIESARASYDASHPGNRIR